MIEKALQNMEWELSLNYSLDNRLKYFLLLDSIENNGKAHEVLKGLVEDLIFQWMSKIQRTEWYFTGVSLNPEIKDQNNRFFF